MKWLVAVLVVACSMPASAQEEEPPFPEARPFNDPLGLGVKSFQYFLGAKIEQWFDDNITLSETNTESDLITVLIPDLKLAYETGKEDFAKFHYRGRMLIYADNDDFNGMEHFIDASARVHVGHFYFDISEEMKDRKESFDVLQIIGRLDSSLDTFRLTAGADFNKLDLEVTFARQSLEFDDAALEHGNYVRSSWSILAGTDIAPRTTGFIEITLGETSYDRNIFSDFSAIRTLFGVKGEPSQKILCNVRAGFSRSDSDEKGVIASDNFSGLIVLAAVTWKISETQALKGEVVRQNIESLLSGLAVINSITADYEHEFTERISATGGFTFETQQEASGGDDRTAWNLRAGAKYHIGDNYTLDAWVQYRTKSSDDGFFEFDNVRGYVGFAGNW